MTLHAWKSRLAGGLSTPGEKVKALVFGVAVAACVAMTLYCHFIRGTDVVFAHLFYVPIVMAGFWWRRRAVAAALFLAGVLLVSHLLSAIQAMWVTDLLRCAMFAMVALVVGELKMRCDREESALRESQGYCDKLVRHASGPIVVWDNRNRISVVNHTMARMIGRDPEDLLGQPVEILFPDEGRPEGIEKLQKLAQGQSTEAVELSVRGGSGKAAVCLWNATNLYDKDGKQRIATMIIGQDVTRVKETERALRRSEQQYRTMVEYSNDLIWTKDLEGRFTFINRRAHEVTGHGTEEICGKTCEGFVVPRDARRVRRVYESSLSGHPQTFDVSIRSVRGQMVDLLVNTAPVYDGEQVVGTVSFGMEVTERRKTEQEKDSLRAQLCQSQKMEAVGRLAGGIAHQLNNLLTIIQGYADFALSSLVPGTALHTDVKEIRSASVRSADLIRQLLLFSRTGMNPPARVNLNEMISGIAAVLSSQLPPTVRLSLTLEDALWTVDGDGSHLKQILVNLVLNARDAMPDGGELIIGTENVYLRNRLAGASLEMRPGKYVRLSVRDSGRGIDKRIINRIFDPFFTTKGVGEGSGLGLSVVYGITKQHQGWVDVDSHVGEGSVFSVYLPVSSDLLGEEAQKEVVIDTCGGHGERILLVEDSEGVRVFASRALAANGYVVSAAADAREAEELFHREKGQFDLVFSDVVLPDESGPHLVKRLRERKPELKAVFATGYTKGRGDWNLIEEGGYAYILKPYSLYEMLALIHCELTASKPGGLECRKNTKDTDPAPAPAERPAHEG